METKHLDIKSSLKAALTEMGDNGDSTWMDRLTWVMLGRRAALQVDLKASSAEMSAEMTLGVNPRLPSDILGDMGPLMSDGQTKELLQDLRHNNLLPAVQMSADRNQQTNLPDMSNTTHVHIKKGQP